MPEFPGWAWLSLIWLVLCTALAVGLGRWFRYMRDEDEEGQ